MNVSIVGIISHFGDPEHITYFLCGVVISGVVSGVAGFLYGRLVARSRKVVITFDRRDM